MFEALGPRFVSHEGGSQDADASFSSGANGLNRKNSLNNESKILNYEGHLISFHQSHPT